LKNLKYIILNLEIVFLIFCSPQKPTFDLFLSEIRATCVTFVRPGDVDHYIGYRIVEHKPEITDHPISGYENQPERITHQIPDIPDKTMADPLIPKGTYNQEWLTQYQSEKVYFRSYKNGIAHFRYKEAEGLHRILIMKAVSDGVEIWLWLESEEAISGSYIIQSCFRLSGDTNSKWRHGMAIVPELSEYDVWSTGDTLSLTYVSRDRKLSRVDAKKEKIIYYTSATIPYLQMLNQRVEDKYIVPHGLIIRESLDSTSVAGMYWERTVRISNHHPADCLHAYVDLGPVRPYERKIVHGKMYWFRGNKDDLLYHWQKDFK
jgi:hypothetical protein